MPRRTMSVTRLWYHPRRKPDELGDLTELPDESDLLDMFDKFLTDELTADSLVRAENERYATLQSKRRIGRSITVRMESGRFGEDGAIKDVTTHEQVGEFTRDNATTVVTHGVLLVPKTGTSALVFSERSAGVGGMPALVDHFVDAFNAKFTDYLMKKQSVVRTDAWLQAAELMRVEGTIRRYTTDPASDAGDQVVGELTHTLVPPRDQKYFPRRVWEHLRDRRIDRAKFLGFAEGTEPDAVGVTVTHGGQTKRFELDHEKTPSLSLVLTTSGEPAFDESRVRNTALNEAAGIFDYYGIEWSESDAIRQEAQE